jgi:hypothetical protein
MENIYAMDFSRSGRTLVFLSITYYNPLGYIKSVITHITPFIIFRLDFELQIGYKKRKGRFW